MKKVTSFFSAVLLAILCFSLVTYRVEAHSGKTDGKGGHTNHATGEYHYHHGYSAHDHYDIDGDGKIDCPYTFDYDSTSDVESESSTEEFEWSIIDYSIDFTVPTFSYPEYAPIPEYYKSTSESSNTPPAYVSLSIMGVVGLIMIVAYKFGRRK